MTTLMTTSSTMAPRATGAAAAAAESSSPADRPGRWVGGLIGVVTFLAAALIGGLAAESPGILSWYSCSAIGLLGMPIGFILGRELLPMARGAGWGRALNTGMLLGWIAPPLGAIEILGGSRLLDLANLNNSMAGPITLVLLPVAIPLSFMAIVMTIPLGLAWGVLVRLVPDDVLTALRVPRPLERVGIRHALVLIAAALILLELAVRS